MRSLSVTLTYLKTAVQDIRKGKYTKLIHKMSTL